MKITIKATNIELTPQAEDWARKKIDSLSKFFDKYIECFVEIGTTTKHHRSGPIYRAEADIRIPNKVLRAEATNKNLNVAVNAVKNELQRQIKKYKGKLDAKEKRGGRLAKRVNKATKLTDTPGSVSTSIRRRNEGI